MCDMRLLWIPVNIRLKNTVKSPNFITRKKSVPKQWRKIQKEKFTSGKRFFFFSFCSFLLICEWHRGECIIMMMICIQWNVEILSLAVLFFASSSCPDHNNILFGFCVCCWCMYELVECVLSLQKKRVVNGIKQKNIKLLNERNTDDIIFWMAILTDIIIDVNWMKKRQKFTFKQNNFWHSIHGFPIYIITLVWSDIVCGRKKKKNWVSTLLHYRFTLSR